MYCYNTVETPNKGPVVNNNNIMNSAVLSFIERLSSFRGSRCIVRTIIFLDIKPCPLYIERCVMLCPYLRVSSIGSSTVNTSYIEMLMCMGVAIVNLNVALCCM